MIYFFDSSAFAKVFIAEEGSAAVGRLLASLDPEKKIVSSLARLEVRSAIRRHERFGSFSSAIAKTAIALLSEELACMGEHPLSDVLLSNAATMVDRHGLRTLDSLQLATALTVRDSHLAEPVTFVASDVALLLAAKLESLSVWKPHTKVLESASE